MNLILFIFLYIAFAQAEEPCPMIQDNITHGLMSFLGADQVWPGLSQILANKMMPTCKILEIGEYEDINIDREDSLTTVEHKYRLKRVSEKHYEVSFNLSFYESLKSYSDKKNRKNDNLLNQSWRLNQTWSDRVAECLKNIEGKAWGPYGEKVTFTLFRSPEGGSSPPKVKIQIMPMVGLIPTIGDRIFIVPQLYTSCFIYLDWWMNMLRVRLES